MPVVNAVKTLCRDVLLQMPSAAMRPCQFKICLPFAAGLDISRRAIGEAVVGDTIKRLAVKGGGVPFYVWGVDRSADFAASAAAGCVYAAGGAVGTDSAAPVFEAPLPAGLLASV